MLQGGLLGDRLELRYPFLYRPLVEFAMSLPPELCVQPQARKWVLRQAMRGILPEVVRTRIGKGGVMSLLGWSLSAQAPLLEPLLHDPILAELGIIDASRFRSAFHDASHRPDRGDHLQTSVQATLLLEAWLQLRAGRWPPQCRLTDAVSAGSVPTNIQHYLQLKPALTEGHHRRSYEKDLHRTQDVGHW
jgi:asparagine synthase (glutamine-hydrolysing)